MPTTEFPLGARPIIHHAQNASADMMRDLYCVFQHMMILRPGSPPDAIFVSYCKLSALFDMREARANSEWMRITNGGKSIIAIELIALTNDHMEANRAAMAYMKSLPEWPHCNKHGYNLERQARRIVCSDGREFNNQDEAAKALGVTASAISQHLNGKLKSVKGYRLDYQSPRDAVGGAT